ncbi:MAG: hypothetical protein KDD34_09045 [Bdellovibrionales bacterium]|nr:hypothetical protein [Bdellovibrionales bacterium]
MRILSRFLAVLVTIFCPFSAIAFSTSDLSVFAGKYEVLEGCNVGLHSSYPGNIVEVNLIPGEEKEMFGQDISSPTFMTFQVIDGPFLDERSTSSQGFKLEEDSTRRESVMSSFEVDAEGIVRLNVEVQNWYGVLGSYRQNKLTLDGSLLTWEVKQTGNNINRASVCKFVRQNLMM